MMDQEIVKYSVSKDFYQIDSSNLKNKRSAIIS